LPSGHRLYFNALSTKHLNEPVTEVVARIKSLVERIGRPDPRTRTDSESERNAVSNILGFLVLEEIKGPSPIGASRPSTFISIQSCGSAQSLEFHPEQL